jgi:cytochrome c biogenesis protein
MENTKCECGHNNPVGTILCEYCGKPLEEDKESNRPLEMRYEGKARRSQTYQATWFDRVWNFFSSVKVAIVLILITLITSAIGTILPQERYVPSPDPAQYYVEQYGFWGEWFYKLGLSSMYDSWWYVTLLAMIGISLVVCSLDRVIPLYKALKNQQVTKDLTFISRQKVSYTLEVPEEERDGLLDRLATQLQNRRFRVRREGHALLAEKGRISRWGPYINHIGLILFLFGALLRLVPGWYLDQFVWVREGEIAKVPEMPYYVKNNKAEVEFYDPKELPGKKTNSQPTVKQYKSDITLLRQDPRTGRLEPVSRKVIMVNHPMEYKGLMLFQSGFQPNQPVSLQMTVTDKKTKKSVGTFTVNLYHPKESYPLKNGGTVRILNYFPDFTMEGDRPATKSEFPNRPAFVFEVITPELKKGEKSWMIAQTNLDDINRNNRYDISMTGLQVVDQSGLMVRVDKSLLVIFFGAAVCMIGLVMGFYWQHRRVWLRWHEGRLYLGAHTNKNWFGLKREVEQIAERAGLKLSLTQLGQE